MVAAAQHRPVLVDEVLDGLAVRADGVYVDATYGRGGHAAAIAERLGPEGVLVVVDRDPEAIAAARADFGGDPRVHIVQGDFAMLGRQVASNAPRAGVDGILLDLGVSSPQLETPARGFSFDRDGPLDMRMDPTSTPSAGEWLAEAAQSDIADVLWRLGEERHARRIARAIVRARERAPIERTHQLAEIVAAAVPGPKGQRHPATRTFQAIRMHINGELDALDAALAAVPGLLAPGGRLVVISFHSLEDRRVKRFIRAHTGGEGSAGRDARGQPLPAAPPEPDAVRLRAITAARPAEADEVRDNPRARSARLRVAERLP
jgi:16S rRNA (cytosine1402-N4)-methyltransferase